MAGMNESPQAHTVRKVTIAFVLLLAFAVRMAGNFGQGHPYSFYPDEQSNVERSVVFYDPAKGLDLNPRWFNKPALGYYLNFGEFGFYYLYGRYVRGFWESPTEFSSAFMNDRQGAQDGPPNSLPKRLSRHIRSRMVALGVGASGIGMSGIGKGASGMAYSPTLVGSGISFPALLSVVARSPPPGAGGCLSSSSLPSRSRSMRASRKVDTSLV